MADEQNSNDTLTPSRARKAKAPLTPEQRARKQAAFLKAYRRTGNITYSCTVAHISRQTFYEWRDKDAAFADQLPDADLEANDVLEAAAYDRAVNGVPSVVVSMGRVVYEEIPDIDEETGKQKLDRHGEPLYTRGKPIVERKYSDALLTTLLKARMPEKYKDRVSNEHSAPGGGPVQVHVFLPD